MKRYIFSLLILLSTQAYLLAQTKKNEPLSVVQKIPGTKLSFKMVLIPGGEFTIGSEGQGFRDRKSVV